MVLPLSGPEQQFVVWGATGLVGTNAVLLRSIYHQAVKKIADHDQRLELATAERADIRRDVDLLRTAIQDKDNGIWASLHEIKDMLTDLDTKNEARHEALRARIHDMNDRTQRVLAQHFLAAHAHDPDLPEIP